MRTRTILFILSCVFLSSITQASGISWIDGLNKPAAWTIDPCEPGQNDIITFSGPVGPIVNTCYAMAYLGGTPTISIDNVNKVVELWFDGPGPSFCPLTYEPVCGLTGEFGPLSPGNWTFKSTQSYIAFEIPFTIEATGQIYYVDYDSPSVVQNGKNWKWAFHNLQDALDIATPGDTIYVAQGTYKPDEGGSEILGDKMAAFSPAPGVTLIGSCAGYGYPDPNLQDIDATPTILTGDLNSDDIWGILNTLENSYQVVRISGGMSNTVVLDGFVIKAGRADGSDPMNSGAGLNINKAKVQLVNSTVSGNIAGFGGGISCKNAELSMWNCKVTGNTARINGGGLYNYESKVDMTNCLLAGNSADMEAYTGGAAIHNLAGDLIILDSTIADNTDGTLPANGKAITSYAWKFPVDSNLVIANSILYNGGNEILTNHLNSVEIGYSDIQGGWTGTGNINKNPQFTAPGQRSIEGEWINGDYTLKNNSPCIDKGSNLLLPLDIPDLDKDTNVSEQLPRDLAGSKRILNSIVDMGAYEKGTSTIPTDPEVQDGVWINVPTVVPDYPIDLQSNPAYFEICLNFPATLTLEAIPTSLAGGTWSAYFVTDPGVVGPGCVTVTVVVVGENVDLSKLSPGLQQIAELSIYVQPVIQ